VSNYKETVNYEDLEAMQEAFNAGQITHEHIYRVMDTNTFFRLAFDGKGMVEIADPASPENDSLLIWWMDKHHVMANGYYIEQANNGQINIPFLPGHLNIAINSIHRNTAYDGKLIVPLNLRSVVDPDHVDDVTDEQSMKALLAHQFVGIPFEIAHYDKIKHYAGIITTMDLGIPDLCAIREALEKKF